MLDILICVYTCERHRRFLEAFYQSVVGVYLQQLTNARILEVYASPEVEQSFVSGHRLILRATESYETLSLKTYEMIRYCVQNFEFKRLLKIDVTTVQTRFDGPEYAGRVPLDLTLLLKFLRESSPAQDYDGFLCHAHAGREGAMLWASKKGRTIDYERLFGQGPMPPFYSGKCYFLSKPFATFISNHGAEMAREHVECLIGAEDVMVGRLYQKFLGALGR